LGRATAVKPADLKVEYANVLQQKNGKAPLLPIHPNLQDALDAIPDLAVRDCVVISSDSGAPENTALSLSSSILDPNRLARLKVCRLLFQVETQT
jgi:hypothetical protein